MKRETDRMRVGKRGEDEACRYLVERGHAVIARNWRGGHLEIDIIALAPDGLHFVEVKSRTAPTSADPEVNVTSDKQRRLTRAAAAFMRSEDGRRVRDEEIFFDVLTVVFEGESAAIEYYPQAFIPIYV